MSRYRRGEYRAERRGKLVERPAAFTTCQGDMGSCVRKSGLADCGRCGKPYCGEHSETHRKYCLGVG